MAYNADTQDGSAPTQQVAPPSSGFGHPIYDQIGAFVKDATGKDPTLQDVSQWGTNIDANYLNSIRSSIYGSEGAKAYQASKNAPPAATPPPATETAPGPPAATGSPVAANGSIPPPAPQAAPAPTPAAKGATPNETRYVTPVDLASVANYNPATFASTYKPTDLPTWAAPDQSGNDAQQSALMKAILANPQTMNPSVVAQMKEAQKEQALLMASQTQQGMDASGAARGTLGSGAADANTRANHEAAINSILTGNRNTDITAASTNRQDELNAASASEALAQGQLGRATSSYSTGLNRAIAGDSQNQFKSSQQLAVDQANADQQYKAEQDQLTRLLSQFGVNTGVANNSQQNYGADLAAQLQQFTQSLDTSKFGENQRQFNDTLGYNYNALDQSGQQSLLSYLQSIGA